MVVMVDVKDMIVRGTLSEIGLDSGRGLPIHTPQSLDIPVISTLRILPYTFDMRIAITDTLSQCLGITPWTSLASLQL
jgi:hypothetical protein